MEQHSPASAHLHRALGIWDLVLMNVSAIVSIRWFSTAAQSGSSSLVLWVLALLIFFIPLGLTVLELNARMPAEGGLYLWTKVAFGSLHGFIAGWSYWVSNLVYYPSLLLFIAGTLPFLGGEKWLYLSNNVGYNATFSLFILWLVIGLNIIGIKHARWIQNIGGICTGATVAVLIGASLITWYQFGSATDFNRKNLMPDLTRLPELSFFATMTFAFVGLELAPIMGAEIKNIRRSVPRAMAIAGTLILGFYILGTGSLLVALPSSELDVINGIPQALASIGNKLGIPGLGALVAGLIVVATTGQLAAWITGAARLPYVVGVDRYLPKALGRIHPRWGSPYIALIMQGILSSLLLLAAVSGSTTKEAYWILLDMTILLTFLPFLYLFAALPVLRMQSLQADKKHNRIPGGLPTIWVVAGLGFSATLLSIVFALTSSAQSKNPEFFFLKVLGGAIIIILVGLAFYFQKSSTH